MDIERELIIAVLKLTKDGTSSHELINKEARVPLDLTRRLLRSLQYEGLIYVRKGYIKVDSVNRLKLAVRAISLGADPERVSNFLQWREFEAMAAITLERGGYVVARNLRFRHAGRRWEIDIVAWKKPLAICVDCKHWHHGPYPSALKAIVSEQIERTEALTKCLPSLNMGIEWGLWREVKMIPAILSLTVGNVKFFDAVPVVPILQLRDFLDQLPVHVDSLRNFSVVSHDVDDRFSDETRSRE
jgi:Holliday junction resolvase-like predicted endonuclease